MVRNCELLRFNGQHHINNENKTAHSQSCRRKNNYFVEEGKVT